MASVLNVDQINNAAGTSAVTIDPSTGKPSFPNGATLPAGSVVQVVNATGNTETVVGGGTYATWVSTNASITITPTSSSSKIFITHMAGGLGEFTQDIGLRLLRGGTATYESVRYGYQPSSQGWVGIQYPLAYVDSPSTTSATTYTIQIRHNNSGAELRHCDNATWSMVAMEIAQ